MADEGRGQRAPELAIQDFFVAALGLLVRAQDAGLEG
jgi:hypothetical protein